MRHAFCEEIARNVWKVLRESISHQDSKSIIW